MRLARNTDDPSLRYLLIKFRHVFDHNKDLDNEPRYNKLLKQYVNLRNIRDMLFDAFTELKAAYELKEYYIRINAQTAVEDASKVIDEAIARFEACGIDEYEEFYRMLVNWRQEIINSLTHTVRAAYSQSFPLLSSKADCAPSPAKRLSRRQRWLQAGRASL